MKKVVLITGAGRGIGAGIAEKFAESGYIVIINYYRSKNEAENLSAKLTSLGYENFLIQADIRKEIEVKEMFEKVVKIYKKIDVLVNNSGVSLDKLLIDTTEEDFQNVMSVNLKGAFFACKYALLNMIEHKSGVIINISSIWGQTGASNESVYSASKAGLIGLTKALAKEYGLSNIRVNAISAGVIESDMNLAYGENFYEEIKEEIPLNKIGLPSDVGDLAVFLSSEKANFITGANISLNGGMYI